jgi:hypothetical protein
MPLYCQQHQLTINSMYFTAPVWCNDAPFWFAYEYATWCIMKLFTTTSSVDNHLFKVEANVDARTKIIPKDSSLLH